MCFVLSCISWIFLPISVSHTLEAYVCMCKILQMLANLDFTSREGAGESEMTVFSDG